MHHPLKLCKAIMSHNALIAHDAAAPVMFVSLLWQMNGTALILNYSIPQDVEANTVRLKEHDHPVLVLEKSPRASTLGNIKYVFGCIHTVPKSTLKLCLQYMCISLYFIKNVWVFYVILCDLGRYTVISGTPEKILEHFLETMRMDIHHSDPGSRAESSD